MDSEPLYTYRHWLVVLWLAALVAFHSAWTSHSAAAFTLNGFDLAEQVGIHPAIRAESPPLRTSGLLWFALPTIAGGLAGAALLYRDGMARWGLRGVAFLVALRMIPPETALRAPRSLINEDYARLLSLLTLLGLGWLVATVIFSRFLRPHLWLYELVLCVTGIVLPLMGFRRAYDLLHELQLNVHLGAGMVLYMLLLAAMGGLVVWRRKLADDPRQHPEVVLAN